MSEEVVTIASFCASVEQRSLDIWEKACDAWLLPTTRANYGDAACDQRIAEYRRWANEARVRRDAAPVKIIAIYADGREEIFT